MDSNDKSVPNENNQREKLVKCPSCEKLNPIYVKFCKYCGQNLPKKEMVTKYCSYCQKKYSNGLKFCTKCGKELIPISKLSTTTSNSENQQGYKIPIHHQHATFDKESQIRGNIISSFKSTETPLIGPKEVKISKSDYFAVEVADEYKMDYKILRDLFSIDNFYSYFSIGIFIYLIYLFWFFIFFESQYLTEVANFLFYNRDSFPSAPESLLKELIIGIFLVLIVEFGLFIPFMLLSIIAAYYGISTRYRIELNQIIIILGINILVAFFDINIPFLILPGEIQLENLPPRKKLAKYVSIGIAINVTIVSILTLPFLINIDYISLFFRSYPLFRHVFICFIMLAWLNMINLLPFGNIISQLVREWKSWLFYLLFIITFGSIFIATNVINAM